METSSSKRIAVISGGRGGVGSAIGKKLLEEGFTVIALGRTASSGDPSFVQCDITNERSAADAIAAIVKTHGSINLAVHAAVGRILRKNLLDMGRAEFEEQFAVDVFGGFCFLREAGKIMKEQRSGALIGILSRVIYPGVSHPKMGGYVVAKNAMRGLLAELDQELSPFNVRVNGIAPDFMDTSLNADLPKEVRQFIIERGTAGSIRTPEDVARAVSYLSSEEGKTIRGTIFSFEENEIMAL